MITSAKKETFYVDPVEKYITDEELLGHIAFFKPMWIFCSVHQELDYLTS